MSRNSSNILFDLVRSLTWSERKTFADDIAKSHNTNHSDEPPIYMRLIHHLSKLEGYNDKEVKQHFGYEGLPESAWRGLKRDTIERLERSIANARGNATPRHQLQAIPNLILLLTQKGIWSRAETHCKRMIKVAEELQEYERLSQLIRQMQEIVAQTRPVEVAEPEFDDLQGQLMMVELKLTTEREYQTLWHKITFQARKMPSNDKMASATKILNHNLLEAGKPNSIMSEHYYWRIRQRAAYLLRDRDQYLESLENSIVHSRKHLDRFQFFESFLQGVSDRIQIHLLAHESDEANRKIQELEQMIKEEEWSGYMMARAEFSIHLNQMTNASLILEENAIKESVKKFEIWFTANSHFINPDMQLKILKRAMVTLFLGNDLSGAARIAYGIRTQSPSVSIAQTTAFAWMFYLIVRLEQKEYEIIIRELNATRKFYKKHQLGNELYHALGKAIEVAAQNRVGTDSQLFRDNTLPICELVEQPAFQYFENFFPFKIWLKSVQDQIPFPDSLKVSSKPYYLFQN